MNKLSMIHRLMAATLISTALTATASVWGDVSNLDSPSKVHSLNMERGDGTAKFVIEAAGTFELQDFFMEEPARLVLDFMGAEHGLLKTSFEGDGDFVQRVRTSQFTNEPGRVTRVVFDMTRKASYDINNSGGSVVVSFRNKDEIGRPVPKVTPPETITPKKNTPETPMESSLSPLAYEVKPRSSNVKPSPPAWQADDKTQQTAGEVKGNPVQWNRPPAPAPVTEKVVPKTSSPQVSTTTSWGSNRSTQGQSSRPAMMTPQMPPPYATSSGLVKNKNITIDVQSADIKTVLRSVSEFSKTNIISGPEVEGKVTAHLKNVPWRQALEIILKAHGFGFRDEYGVIRVSTLANLTKEELELQAAERKKDDLLPLITRIISVSFANAEEMNDALREILTSRGSMEVERGTNALIVTDIEKVVDKIQIMVGDLDRKILQVEIVAKMVDVDFEASQEMGIRWDVLNLHFSDVNASASATIDARSATPVGTFRIGTVQSWGEIQNLIDLLAKKNKANIISNPRIVTADNREASILVGKEIPLIVSDEAGNPITELTKVGIMLRVTPHVNSDNTISMDLHPEVSELSSQATVQGGVIISLSEADTRVVVADGETAVIGGLISEVESELESGVPVLKDIPVLGNLFKLRNTNKKKRELIIFVTPRIVGG
jgi:type IV pilus assembly protein PilQ